MLFDRLALLVETMLYVECIFQTNIPHLPSIVNYLMPVF